jgi:molecular chaperone DnaJ
MEFYEALGVKRGASATEIRRAWQRLSRALHPALNPGDPAAAERYHEAAAAFEVLSDPQRRAAYDRGERPVAPVAPPPHSGFEGFDFSAEVRVETVGFRDIFDEALLPPRPEPGLQGEDLEQATRLSFEESMTGTARHVHLVRFEPCHSCNGLGDVAFGPVRCQRCRGTGVVRGSRGHMIFSRRCGECEGTGEIRRIGCQRCGGEGRVIASEWLDVHIPAGVGNGSQVRLPGAGNAGRRGGPAGDFVLTIEVEEHPFFRRDGEDLHCTIDVGMIEAAMGGHVEVKTAEGPVTIEVPAGTQNGQRFRLRKRGVPRVGEEGRGDLWVEARIVVRPVVSEAGRALLRQLKALQDAAGEDQAGAAVEDGAARRN